MPYEYATKEYMDNTVYNNENTEKVDFSVEDRVRNIWTGKTGTVTKPIHQDKIGFEQVGVIYDHEKRVAFPTPTSLEKIEDKPVDKTSRDYRDDEDSRTPPTKNLDKGFKKGDRVEHTYFGYVGTVQGQDAGTEYIKVLWDSHGGGSYLGSRLKMVENMANRQATLSVSEDSTENRENMSDTEYTEIYLVMGKEAGTPNAAHITHALAKADVTNGEYLLTVKIPTDLLQSTKPKPHAPVLELS